MMNNQSNRLARAVILAMAVMSPASFAETRIVTISDVDDIRITPLTALPSSPEDGLIDEHCKHYQQEAHSDAARHIADLDWIVTSEERLGRFLAITFASGFDEGTSRTCFARNANLAIFENSQLRALAYTTKASGNVLGTVRAIESGGLTIDNDGPGGPQAEIHEVDGGVRITPMAAEATFCGGRVTVPNIHTLSIKDARIVLKKAGWMPSPNKKGDSDFSLENNMVRQGLPEIEFCQGTGWGYCEFGYRNKLGKLGVTTMGGSHDDGSDHMVIGYAATCPPAPDPDPQS